MFDWLTDTFAGIDSCFIYACVKAGLKFQQTDALKESIAALWKDHMVAKSGLLLRG